MIKDLIKMADHLDAKGLAKEANFLDGIINKYSKENEDDGLSLEEKYNSLLLRLERLERKSENYVHDMESD